MKKHGKWWILCLLLLAAAMIGGAYYIRYDYIRKNYVEVEGQLYERGSVIDLSDSNISGEEYERLTAEYSDVSFVWLVPVCGMRLDPATEALTVPAGVDPQELSEDIRWLKELKSVDLTGAGFTNEENKTFADAHPELEVTYYVVMDGVEYDPGTSEFQLEYRPELIPAIQAAAPYFTNGIQVVDFGTQPLEPETAREIDAALEGIEVRCYFTVCGIDVPRDTEALDLTDVKVTSTAELENAIAALPNLKRIDVYETSLSNNTLDTLNQSYPEVEIVWTIYIWGSYQTFELRTDRDNLCLSQFSWGYYIGFGDDGLYNLRYCRNMVTLDLGHTEITNINMCAYMPHLQYLIIVDTKVTSLEGLRNCYEIYYIEAFFCRIKDFSPLADKTTLRHLNICNTRCSNAKLLSSMTWLDRLWIKNTFMSRAACKSVERALKDTFVVWDVRVYGDNACSDGYWREDPSYFEMRDNLGLDYMK